MSNSDYKLASIDISKISSAARQALMAADEQYHAWPADKQEKFRATMSELSRKNIQRILLKNLLKIESTSDTIDSIWDEIPLAELNELNWANLLTSGIGEDYIYLNESMADGKTLLDFATLYDYDYADYLFQEQANKQDFENYQGADYYAYRYPSWVRLLIKEKFYYASFFSLATFLCDEIDAAGSDLINQLIPHEYVEGKNHGKREQKGFLWNMQIDANGQEGQLDELNRRWYKYLQESWLRLSKINSQLSPAVYTQDKDWDNDPQRFFIFNNEVSLKKIRWKHFLRDCEPLMSDFLSVEERLKEEIVKVKSWLQETHELVMNTYDPKVIKFGKKRKLIISDGAIDDLQKIESEDDDFF